MSRHSDDYALAFAELLDAHGDTITYTPAAGAASTPSAIVVWQPDEYRQTDRGLERARVAEVSLSAADVATPALDDQVTVGSLTLAVEAIVESDASHHVLRCVRSDVVEESDQDLRAAAS